MQAATITSERELHKASELALQANAAQQTLATRLQLRDAEHAEERRRWEEALDEAAAVAEALKQQLLEHEERDRLKLELAHAQQVRRSEWGRAVVCLVGPGVQNGCVEGGGT